MGSFQNSHNSASKQPQPIFVDILWHFGHNTIPKPQPGLPIMPITQTRMTTLIMSARDYKQAIESLADHIVDLAAQRYNHPSPLELLEQIHLAASNWQGFMRYPQESHDTLLLEHTHFIRNARRNAKNADDLRKRRANPTPNSYYVSPHEVSIETMYREAAMGPGVPPRLQKQRPQVLDPDLEPDIPPHILAAAARFDAKDNRRREIIREAEELRADILSRAAMIMNQRNVTLETVQREAQAAYDEYIEEQTNDEGF